MLKDIFKDSLTFSAESIGVWLCFDLLQLQQCVRIHPFTVNFLPLTFLRHDVTFQTYLPFLKNRAGAVWQYCKFDIFKVKL